MSAEAAKKGGKLTVFKTDRHEDWGAIVLVGLVVSFTLIYMAYIVPDVKIKAPQDGKIASVAVAKDAVVKKGDLLFVLDYKKKKYVQGKVEETPAKVEIKAKTNGKILDVKAKEGDAVKKDKETLIVMEHEKGTLP